jgi:CDP-glucose 4,6-dehydratase
MGVNTILFSFYQGKRVMVTGHTGFKGSWLSKVLLMAGAEVTGFALDPPTNPALFNLLDLDKQMESIRGDVRDFSALFGAVKGVKPEIVIHMAAQPLVRDSYRDPVYTYETNVMGTVNLLEAVRQGDTVRSVVNVTTDKVYRNNEWVWGYRENEPLDGYDPYSNSKSCSELVTASYVRSFFNGASAPAISTMRAGNVIGGGDFSSNRIVPDCIRAATHNEPIVVRNPLATRPYQHVLEPIYAYLMLAQKQYEDQGYAGQYNVGPEDCDCVSTSTLVDLFCHTWGNGLVWEHVIEHNAPYEASYLKLDCSKLTARTGWHPRWHIDEAIYKTVAWHKAQMFGKDVNTNTEEQIQDYLTERQLF